MVLPCRWLGRLIAALTPLLALLHNGLKYILRSNSCSLSYNPELSLEKFGSALPALILTPAQTNECAHSIVSGFDHAQIHQILAVPPHLE